jgi:hypothetical protein
MITVKYMLFSWNVDSAIKTVQFMKIGQLITKLK